jgi:hypothetical protein
LDLRFSIEEGEWAAAAVNPKSKTQNANEVRINDLPENAL